MAVDNTIRFKFDLDTTQAKQGFNDFKSMFTDPSPSIKNMDNSSMVQGPKLPSMFELSKLNTPNNTEELIAQKNTEKLSKYAQEISAVGTVTDKFKNIVDTSDKLNNVLEALVKNIPESENRIQKQKTNEEKKAESNIGAIEKTNLDIVRSGTNAVQSLSNGNIGGAIVGGLNSTSTMFSNGSRIAQINNNDVLSEQLGALGIGAAAIALIGGAASTLTDKYQESLESSEKAFSAFTSAEKLNGYDAKTNSSLAFIMRGGMKESARDTGLTVSEFQDQASELSKYGVTSLTEASNMTREAALMARFTNGDINQFNRYLGTMARYSGGTSADLSYAYGAARASGLQKDQFGEFLSGLQKVIEDGIAKGYTKSTDEVAETMVMFGKLSGNSALWQGEQGATKINQLNNGLASAASLSNSTQVLAYQALNGLYDDKTLKSILNETDPLTGRDRSNTYIEGQDALNTYALMERGLDSKTFYALGNAFNNQYGGDVRSQVEAWKQLSGLNETGAMQLYNMYKNPENLSSEELDKKIKSMQTDSKYLSDSTNMTNALNDLSMKIEAAGKSTFNVKVDALETTNSMLGILIKEPIEKEKEKILDDTFQYNALGTEEEEKDIRNKFNTMVADLPPEEQMQALNSLRSLGELTPDQKSYFNEYNLQKALKYDNADSFSASVLDVIKRTGSNTYNNLPDNIQKLIQTDNKDLTDNQIKAKSYAMKFLNEGGNAGDLYADLTGYNTKHGKSDSAWESITEIFKQAIEALKENTKATTENSNSTYTVAY